MSGSGFIGRALGIRKATTERSDVLAYMARRRANCALVAERCPEFADDARVQQRQLTILIDEIEGGLHEGEAEIARDRAVACTDPYPFVDHRSMAEADSVPEARAAEKV